MRHKKIYLETWTGEIVSVNERKGVFTAYMNSGKQLDTPEEIQTFDIKRIPKSQQRAIKVGGIFVWYLGYRINRYGKPLYWMEFEFRKSYCWTKEELRKVKIEARKLRKMFGLNEENRYGTNNLD